MPYTGQRKSISTKVLPAPEFTGFFGEHRDTLTCDKSLLIRLAETQTQCGSGLGSASGALRNCFMAAYTVWLAAGGLRLQEPYLQDYIRRGNFSGS